MMIQPLNKTLNCEIEQIFLFQMLWKHMYSLFEQEVKLCAFSHSSIYHTGRLANKNHVLKLTVRGK